VNARDKAGRTPLFYAMDDPDEFTTHSPPILLAAGADVNVVDLQGTSLLEEAVWFGFQRDFAKQLLKHGAKFTIHAAAGFGFATKVRELVAEGVDPNRQLARDGTAPLHWAARLGQTEAARALIEVGADVDLQDGQGRRPLHYACGRYLMRPIPKADVTRVLLEAGADTGATTAKGETAAQIAQRSLQEDALAVLQEYAARQ
jgi:ankyrin repeat protein